MARLRSEVREHSIACADQRESIPTNPATLEPSARYVWYVLVLLGVVNIFNYMDRMALSVLLPYIKSDLNLSDGELGLLVGLAFSLFYALFGVPIAMWADRGVRRNIIALALATWSLMTGLGGFAQNFLQLFATRIGVGVGEAGCLPPSQSIICDYVPLQRRAGAFAMNGFGGIVGLMLGMVLAAWLGKVLGWRWTFVVLGVPGLLLAIIVRLTLREPVRGRNDAVNPQQMNLALGDGLRFLWRCKTYKYLILFLVANGFVQFGMNQWWASFYSRVLDLDAATVGMSLGTALGIGSGIGILLGGVLANKSMRINERYPLILSGIPALLAMPTALASLFVPSFFDCMLLVGLTGLLWGVPAGPVVAALYSVTTPAMRATAGAMTTVFTSTIGLGLGPLCVGLLSDELAPVFGNESLRYALLLPVALHPLLTLAAWAAARELPRDLKALNAQAGATTRRSDEPLVRTAESAAS